ncbi:MAG: hypothetical protein F4Y80_01615 [Caldilineaceae bacterium SB0665_bin_21]|nr:hypothetical protein [Caldilineaceae bacterium SB0665_bin_21]
MEITSRIPRSRFRWLVPVTLLVVLAMVLASCGRDRGKSDTMPVFLEEGTEVGGVLKSDKWELEITDFAGKDTLLGDEGEDSGLAQVTQYETSAQTSQRGEWVIVPIRLKNIAGEDALLFVRTIRLRDDQGNEYELGRRNVHLAYIFYTDPETYGDLSNQHVQNVFNVDEERFGPAIFDVPLETTGLVLILEGADGELAVGY